MKILYFLVPNVHFFHTVILEKLTIIHFAKKKDSANSDKIPLVLLLHHIIELEVARFDTKICSNTNIYLFTAHCHFPRFSRMDIGPFLQFGNRCVIMVKNIYLSWHFTKEMHCENEVTSNKLCFKKNVGHFYLADPYIEKVMLQ